jgi:hypothetical protein
MEKGSVTSFEVSRRPVRMRAHDDDKSRWVAAVKRYA